MIKFHLYKLNKSIAFQVLDQDGRFSGRVTKINTFPTFNCILNSKSGQKIDFKIKSMNIPDIEIFKSSICVYVRGSDIDTDDAIVIKRFESNEKRDEVYDLIIQGFNKWKSFKINFDR